MEEKSYVISKMDLESFVHTDSPSQPCHAEPVPYLRGIAERFLANRLSVLALLAFIVCILFAFLGPAFIPYGYADQYRSAQKLAPMTYSEMEQTVMQVENRFDVFYASSLQPGSLASISAGTYTFSFGGRAYGFRIEETLSDVILGFSQEHPRELAVCPIADIQAGNCTTADTIALTATADPDARNLPMSGGVFPHVMGTDSVGRDIMARTMYGTRVSILIGIVATVIVMTIGSVLGAISGYLGGFVDSVIMRITEIISSIPDILVVLLLQVVLKEPLSQFLTKSDWFLAVAMKDLGAGVLSIFITFALLYWVMLARIIRSQVIVLKQQEFITATHALGAGRGRIIFRHLLPNCMGSLIVTACMQIPSAIFMESFLSFLGLGVSAPMTSLGSLCADALSSIELYPYRLLFPALMLVMIVLSLNLIGDGMRDALDPNVS